MSDTVADVINRHLVDTFGEYVDEQPAAIVPGILAALADADYHIVKPNQAVRDGVTYDLELADKSRPHQLPKALHDYPDELWSWECGACGVTVLEAGPREPCPIDWRTNRTYHLVKPTLAPDPDGDNK